MNSIKVFVKKSHIAFGKKHDCTRCPIALAMREQCSIAVDKDSISVAGTFVSFTKKKQDRYYYFNFPQRARNFIRDFDLGAAVKPFSFTAKETKTI